MTNDLSVRSKQGLSAMAASNVIVDSEAAVAIVSHCLDFLMYSDGNIHLT